MSDISMEEGDLVQLKSGGPEMSLVELLADDQAICMWFDSKGKLQERSFPLTVLRKVEQLK